MRKYLFVIAACFLGSIGVKAQQAKPVWVTIQSPNLKCWECKDRLDAYLLRENKANMESAISVWKINLLRGEIKLQYLPDRISADAIRTALNNAGFDADSTRAEPDSYKLLPPSCKRAEDGGGPQRLKPCHIKPY